MEKQNRKRKANKRKDNWLSNWRKCTACTILAVACVVSLVAAMSPAAAKPEATPLEYAQYQYEPYDSEEEMVTFSLQETKEQSIVLNDMVRSQMANLTTSTIPTDNETNSSENSENGSEELDSRTLTQGSVQMQEIVPFEELDVSIQELSINPDEGTEVNLAEQGESEEQITPAEAEIPTEPTAPAETKPTEEQPTTDPTTNTEDQEQEAQRSSEPSENKWKIITRDLEADYSSSEELEKVLNDLYVDCEHDPNWDLAASMKGETIWIEQYEPLTEELIISFGNLIFEEVGGYISTQPYPISMKGYMLTGSVVLHRLELAYRGAKNVHDVVNSPSQYGAKWAFNLKTPVNGNVNECYIVAEMLLRNGPIGPRNLIGQSGGEQGDGTYWVIGEDDCHYKPTYFCTNSKFANYEVIQTEEQEVQTEEPEVQTEEQEAQTEEQEVQTEEQEIQTEVQE